MRGLLLLPLVLAAVAAATAQELRRIDPVPAPGTERPEAATAAFRPVAAETVESVLELLFSAWNTPRLRTLLGPGYHDQARLQDTLSAKVPRDARLRLLAIESVSTLAQAVRRADAGRPRRLVSTVAVFARTQLEYDDPVEGFVRREGVNEYVLRIVEELEDGRQPAG